MLPAKVDGGVRPMLSCAAIPEESAASFWTSLTVAKFGVLGGTEACVDGKCRLVLLEY